MLKLMFISVLVACALAVPIERQSDTRESPRPLLTRPAPINPAIHSEPKPEEKITPIKSDSIESKKDAVSPNPIPGPVNLRQHHQIAVDPIVSAPVKRDIPVPVSLPEIREKSSKSEPTQPIGNAQIAIDQPIAESVKEVKRDIPVPVSLPEKQKTSEVSDKPEEAKKDKELSTGAAVSQKDEEVEQKPHHPATFVHPVPVSQLFGNRKRETDSSGKSKAGAQR